MILSRIASALRRQDWTQVFIELLIVVVGIYLGFQVTEWGEEREERDQERAILTRMHSEVYEGLGYRDELSRSMIFGELQIAISERLGDIAIYFEEGENLESFDYRHCQAIVLSHVYNNTTITLPTMTELLSSGQISLIQSDAVKKALSDYTIASETMTSQTDFFRSVALVMARSYSNFIELANITPTGIETEFNGRHTCDYEGMSRNIAFKNDFYDNKVKQQVFVNLYIAQREAFEAVHDALDQELGISHGEDA